MAKVFTITEGLVNMAPMKTGGQGSVYKGLRTGEIISAVKLLPTPIYSEDEEDKNFRDFKNEVQKLKRVNEKPNPNVVKILSSGLSETGNFPFIEMEYIEGPDLEELLQPPHPPVFTIKEVIKVAEQLSNALAHCHSLGVKHGDIKSNNVKFNIHSGNYVLLDFGLAIMSDEQRRTSLRQAGAVEFMAPEQNEGQMLFQTDVYSFGIVLFELLTGKVPFPLQDRGEAARNNVRLAHMETLPTDIVSLRKEALPLTWPEDKRAREMEIPDWLISVIYKCLNKKPENRFSNGSSLNTFITQNSVHVLHAGDTEKTALLVQEKQQLQKQLLQYRDELILKEREYEELQAKANNKNAGIQLLEVKNNSVSSDENGVAKSSFIAVLFLAIALAAFSGYSYFKNVKQDKQIGTASNKDKVNAHKTNTPVTKKTAQKKRSQVNNKKAALDSVAGNKQKKLVKKLPQQPVADTNKTTVNSSNKEKPNKSATKYTVLSKAYFYSTPDETTSRDAYITHWNNAVLTPSDDMNGFIYIVYTNDKGQTSRGWLRKQDLKPIQ
ncbi:serine/threonine protein kinase [Segetibacter koreensis]|uniref:serine/threonine protein kinase n=1 Tax=Segetibacter koreensis TaxID=398037 RepID=UPI000378C42C|nr:serine/threonine-protein kinase [Segetibacter koreensis]